MNAQEAENEAEAIEAEIERLQARADELRSVASSMALEAFDRLGVLCHSATDDAQNASYLRRLISDSGLSTSTRARLYTWLADILEASK